MKLDESRSRLYDQLRRRPKAHFSGNHALYHYNIPTTSDLMQKRMFRNDKKKAPRPPRESLPNPTLKSQVGSARPPQALQDWALSFPRLQLLRIGAVRPETWNTQSRGRPEEICKSWAESVKISPSSACFVFTIGKCTKKSRFSKNHFSALSMNFWIFSSGNVRTRRGLAPNIQNLQNFGENRSKFSIRTTEKCEKCKKIYSKNFVKTP